MQRRNVMLPSNELVKKEYLGNACCKVRESLEKNRKLSTVPLSRKNSARYDLVNFPQEGCVLISMEVAPPPKGTDQSREVNPTPVPARNTGLDRGWTLERRLQFPRRRLSRTIKRLSRSEDTGGKERNKRSYLWQFWQTTDSVLEPSKRWQGRIFHLWGPKLICSLNICSEDVVRSVYVSFPHHFLYFFLSVRLDSVSKLKHTKRSHRCEMFNFF